MTVHIPRPKQQLIVEYEGKSWVFELVSVGGSENVSRQFASSITIELLSPILDLQVLYLLLVNLTKQKFHGWIVGLDESEPKLTAWEVKREEGKLYCVIGYEVWMPDNELDFETIMQIGDYDD